MFLQYTFQCLYKDSRIGQGKTLVEMTTLAKQREKNTLHVQYDCCGLEKTNNQDPLNSPPVAYSQPGPQLQPSACLRRPGAG